MNRTIHMFAALTCWVCFTGFPAPDDTPRERKEQTHLGDEWKYVGRTDKSDYFVHLRTIRSSGNTRKMWEMDNIVGEYKVKTYKSTKRRAEYDCVNEQRRVVSAITYSEKYSEGEVIETYNNSSSPWLPVTPDSIGETLWNFACKDRMTTPTFDEFLAKARPLNPGYSDREIFQEYRKRYYPD